MKFQLPSLRLLLKMLITFAIIIALGTGLLILVHSIPTDNISKNVSESAITFIQEGYYKQLDNPNSILDSFTDALMLLEAAYDGEESVFQKAMLVPRRMVSSLESEKLEDHLIAEYINHSDIETYTETYARYWHGFLIFLKPALCLFTYSQLSSVNLYLQIALSLAIIILMIIKKCWQAIPAYIVSILMIHPLATAFCLQYATVFYIFSVFSILLLVFQKKLSESKDAIYIFFLIIGAVTAYLDFLTYPIATFCMVAVLYICLERNVKNHVDVRNILNLLISWGIGYMVMFASKWILATILTDSNVIAEAIEAIKFRAGSTYDNMTLYKSDAIQRNLITFLYPPNVFIILGLFVVEIIILIIAHSKFRFDMALSYILIFLLPFIWYLFTTNHSYLHYFFTHKALVGSLYAFLCIFIAWDLGKKSSGATTKNGKRPNKS